MLAAAIFAACEGTVSGEVDSGSPLVEPVVETGASLYAQRCAACHGETGEGTSLAYQLRSPVRPYATWVVRNGRNEGTYPSGMSPITSLSDAQLGLIFDFLDAVPMPDDGEALYVRFCGNCHGAEGRGGRADEDLAGEDEDEIFEKAREGHGGARYGEAHKYMPSWTAQELTDAQLHAIAEYLRRFDDDDDDDDDHG